MGAGICAVLKRRGKNAYPEFVSVGQDVLCLLGVRLGRHILLLLLPRVDGNVGGGLFDLAHNLLLGARVEDVARLAQQRLQVLGDVAAGHVDALDGVADGEALVHRHGVADAVAGVKHDACRAAARVQRQHGLDGHVDGGHVEGLEEYLRGHVAVAARVEWRLGQQHGVLLAQHLEALLVDVAPDPFHLVPVRHDAVLQRVVDLEQAAQVRGRARANEQVALERARQHAQVLGPAHKGREVAFRKVFAREARADGARAIVNDHGDVVEAFRHDGLLGEGMEGRKGEKFRRAEDWAGVGVNCP